MSRRSYNSTSHQNRMSKFLVTDDDIFEYVSNLPCHRKGADFHFLVVMYSAYRKHQTSQCDPQLPDIILDPPQPPELSYTTQNPKDSQFWRCRCSGERAHWSLLRRDLELNRFYWRPFQGHQRWPWFEKCQISREVVEGFGAKVAKHSNGKGCSVRREPLISP
jgi:hypothetical protein